MKVGEQVAFLVDVRTPDAVWGMSHSHWSLECGRVVSADAEMVAIWDGERMYFLPVAKVYADDKDASAALKAARIEDGWPEDCA